MGSAQPRTRSALWWTATAVAAACLFAIALSDSVYEATSPPGPLQILLRKSYSIAAFTLVGILLSKALAAPSPQVRWLFPAASIAAYSLLIEAGQAAEGVREGLLWNGIDVLCGFVGGYFGWLTATPRLRQQR
ncbi:MAG: hypothetical protein DLM53_07985 [Candidatus Eremiobacter antarcticus]|nr:hypothetical protein [Candidatus Eremiobacteraeota bacterium]MBC5807294.1 hypothetical protein [Candidatus Eremiobacteraeota bacterium]PZR61740.1 MAG: hypothetical protein DLM53_07985 [Candidatus Eremiobacter sp. RRmetagenome_bin22]